MSKTKKRKLKVGFDFDGVVAYNPLRIVRPILHLGKKIFLRPKELSFFCPQNAWQRFCWQIIHESSFFPAPGFKLLKKLLKEGKIEGYLLTSRYDHLEDQFYRWLKKHDVDKLFKSYHLNKKDEQPHKFKERTIKKLKLDLFLDDNWDIVNYLNSKWDVRNEKWDTDNLNSRTFNVRKNKNLTSKNRKIKNSRSKTSHISHLTSKMPEIHWIYNILDQGIKYPRKHPHLLSFLKEIIERFEIKGVSS